MSLKIAGMRLLLFFVFSAGCCFADDGKEPIKKDALCGECVMWRDGMVNYWTWRWRETLPRVKELADQHAELRKPLLDMMFEVMPYAIDVMQGYDAPRSSRPLVITQEFTQKCGKFFNLLERFPDPNTQIDNGLLNDISMMRQKLKDAVGRTAISLYAEEVDRVSIPSDFYMSPAFFDSEGKVLILYEVPFLSTIEIVIKDFGGNEVRRLFEGVQKAGYHSIEWDGKAPSGVPVKTGTYTCELAAFPRNDNPVLASQDIPKWGK